MKLRVVRNGVKHLLLGILPDEILLPIKKIHYARSLRKVNEEQEIEIKVVRYLVKEGDYVIDIGANIGLYTKFLSGFVGITGRVYSFEPIPDTFSILVSNLRKLDIENAVLENCAMSSYNGLAIMEVPLYESGGKNFYEARIVGKENDAERMKVEVATKTIDSIFLNLDKKIQFIKCDVEGHEAECIKGAAEVMRSHKPAWLIEISGNPDDRSSDAHHIIKSMRGEGYHVLWFDGKRLRRRKYGDKSVNYFFLTEDQLEQLKEQSAIDTIRC